MACIFCGDEVDELVCYSCEDTAEMMGVDITDLTEAI